MENLSQSKNLVGGKISMNDIGKKISLIKHNRRIDSMCFPANLIWESSKNQSKAKYKTNTSLNCTAKGYNSKPSN